MGGLENLFATDPALPQVVTAKLPEDPNQWGEVITGKLKELYPETGNLPMSIEFRRKDDQSGTAIGALLITSPENEKKRLAVPFIVRKYELFPMDVWMEIESQAIHPLSNDTFKEQFFHKGMSSGLDTRPQDAAGTYFNDPSLWTTNYPPLQGRYSYASAGYWLLDRLSDSFTEADLAAFRGIIEKNAHVVPKFKARGHLEVIQKLAAKKGKTYGGSHLPGAPNTSNFAASALKLIPRNIHSIKRESRDKYSILSAADKMFDLAASEHLNQKDCFNFLSKITGKPRDVLNEVDQEGEKLLVAPTAPKNGVFLFEDMQDKPENATDFACYAVKTKDGITIPGVVIPHVVDFKGKKVGQKLFISAGHSSMQESIAGVRIPDTDLPAKVLKPRGARTGQTGVFVFIDDGKAIATVPVTIKCIEEHGPLTAILMSGQKIKIKRGYSNRPDGYSQPTAPGHGKKQVDFLDVHGMIEDAPHEYTIPRDMLWIPLEDFREVAHTPKEWIMKEAAPRMSQEPVVVRFTGIVYDISGPTLEKNASYDARSAGVLLACMGADAEKVAQILKTAKAKGKAMVYGMSALKKSADIVKLAGNTWGDLEKLCATVRCDLVKEAAEIDNSETVDALLSLNFVNPENVSKFVAYKPVFEKVLDYLAELVVASRLGMQDVAESSAVNAMSKMKEVVEGLHKLESGLRKPEAKTAAAQPAGNAQKAAGHSIHFANGMRDGEMGLHMFINDAKTPKDMLDYMDGKRVSESNKAMAGMAMGIPPKGAPKQKQPGAAPAGGAKQ